MAKTPEWRSQKESVEEKDLENSKEKNLRPMKLADLSFRVGPGGGSTTEGCPPSHPQNGLSLGTQCLGNVSNYRPN